MANDPILPPAKSPCVSCPYRQDVPSGVWHTDEYDKLPLFDQPTPMQPPTVFLCHQQDGRLCAGWTAVHDMEHSLGLRIAASLGMLAAGTLEAAWRYTTKVKLWSSGAEAAAHGRREIARPSQRARQIVRKVSKKPGVTLR